MKEELSLPQRKLKRTENNIIKAHWKITWKN